MITSRTSATEKLWASTNKEWTQSRKTSCFSKLCSVTEPPATLSSVSLSSSQYHTAVADGCQNSENYGSVLRDCSEAIRLNSHCSKAYYRSALALLSLDRPEEALDATKRGLEFNGSNSGLLTVQQRAERAKSVKDEKESKRVDALKREASAKERMRNALKVTSLQATGVVLTIWR